MPLAAQSLHHNIGHRLPALAAFGTVSIGMTVAAPRIPVLLNKWRTCVERIATLCAEEVAGMPFSAASNDDLAFDGRLARFAARAEHLVEVEGTVETQ